MLQGLMEQPAPEAAKESAEEHKNEVVNANDTGNPEKADGSKVVEGSTEKEKDSEA